MPLKTTTLSPSVRCVQPAQFRPTCQAAVGPRLDLERLETRGEGEANVGVTGLGTPSKRNRASLSDPQSVGEEQLWLQSSSDLKPLKTPIVLMMVPPASSLPFG